MLPASDVHRATIDIRYRTARGGKVDFLRGFWKGSQNFEAVQIDDVATSDFADALEGKHVIAHSVTLRTRIDTERCRRSML